MEDGPVVYASECLVVWSFLCEDGHRNSSEGSNEEPLVESYMNKSHQLTSANVWLGVGIKGKNRSKKHRLYKLEDTTTNMKGEVWSDERWQGSQCGPAGALPSSSNADPASHTTIPHREARLGGTSMETGRRFCGSPGGDLSRSAETGHSIGKVSRLPPIDQGVPENTARFRGQLHRVGSTSVFQGSGQTVAVRNTTRECIRAR